MIPGRETSPKVSVAKKINKIKTKLPLFKKKEMETPLFPVPRSEPSMGPHTQWDLTKYWIYDTGEDAETNLGLLHWEFCLQGFPPSPLLR